ncbi:iron complex transport system substrate-binding protein [Silvimonas terrae]|uniref:Iron complex transport system substrate-binding protein n=1 Tax=Silvimonas terrae TaxID=300266 RepID=A0A840RDW2_9NEIS|nr:ABC transporter substrate-binding protein [Silvimonas terrae]MBB5191689.1 iron complex transport system substrate-binding protein [Silvimonas terrae]
MKQLFCALWLGLVATLAHAADTPKRVVSLGGPLTEIIYALGAGDRLVGADNSSLYPPAATKLPQVGYYRAFSVEGVAALNPDLILATDQAGPPAALKQLQSLGKRIIVLPGDATLEALEQRVHGVATALGLKDDGGKMVAQIRADIAPLQGKAAGLKTLLVMNRTGKLEGAGTDTTADAMLNLAGAKNVLATQKGYKPLSAEAALALAPQAIVTTSMSITASGGLDAFLALPGVAGTPAAKARRIVVMDDLLLLGFGPRLPQALRTLQAGLLAPAS